MKACPKCGSPEIDRSRHRSVFETWRKAITGKRPYRCRACGARVWGAEAGPHFHERDVEIATRAMAPEPPDLAGPVVINDNDRPDIDLRQLDLPEPSLPTRTTPAGKPRP